MHAVVRTYSGKGTKELVDALEKHKADVEHLMRPIKGFVSYTLAHVTDGCVSVTVCETKAGADESIQKARDWIAKNVPTISVGAMSVSVSEGSVILHLK
jgi:hypothetical protein